MPLVKSMVECTSDD